MTDILERLRAALGERYAIERQAGEGGMATVWLARDLKHGRDVAVKVLRPELGASIGTDRLAAETSQVDRNRFPGQVEEVAHRAIGEGEHMRERLRTFDEVEIRRHVVRGDLERLLCVHLANHRLVTEIGERLQPRREVEAAGALDVEVAADGKAELRRIGRDARIPLAQMACHLG